MDLPDIKYSSVINMPSSDFQKIVRDLANISEKLEIKSVGEELIFKCCGQYAKAEIRRSETSGTNSMQFLQKQNPDDIIQGEFSLKNLWVKRPGNGISPMKLDEVIGTKAVRNYSEDELI